MVKRRAMAADTSTLSPSANSATAASSPVTLASAVARNVYGFESVILTAYGVNTAPGAVVLRPGDVLLLGLAELRRGLERDLDRVALGRHEPLRLAVGDVAGRR